MPAPSFIEFPPTLLNCLANQSQVDDAILLLIGYTGLARSSALVRILAHTIGFPEKTVRNALLRACQQPNKLRRIELYHVHGNSMVYHTHRHGPPIKLYILTQIGAARFHEMTGAEIAESEIFWAVRRGGNVDHGLGIVETGEALTALAASVSGSCAVDWDPHIKFLSDADAHLPTAQRKRCEPDLYRPLMGRPIEYEIDGKANRHAVAKWVKACQAYGAVDIVTPNRERARKMLVELERLRDLDAHAARDVEVIAHVFDLVSLQAGCFESERFHLVPTSGIYISIPAMATRE